MKDIDAVADKINKDFASAEDIPIILCVLKGALMFTSEILRRLDFLCELQTIRLQSYDGDHSTGVCQQILGLNTNIKGRRVIIVEDIVDTGNSMEYLMGHLKELGAEDVKICSMLFKPSVFKKDFKIDYVARSIPPAFIVGFGLDYNEMGRQFKDIYVAND